jgi:GNAT superfamily N-acetyltransferase
MPDMLVKLYALPELQPALAALAQQELSIRRPHPSEKHILADWVRRHFQESWAVGCENALERQSITGYIAIAKARQGGSTENPYDLPPERLLGFVCYDVAARGMFGPIGVREDYRQRGIGTALVLACLHAMKEDGYAYAVIGWAGSINFYARAAGATVIPDSEPGIFRVPLVVRALGRAVNTIEYVA